ncbi:MAG: PQQ-binding-like beta-propeller repeat protein [Lentisphaeria bacterium]|nr:PQQ-binding-like beta-propeller repeat protein [Lentisphaeria bacterium]
MAGGTFLRVAGISVLWVGLTRPAPGGQPADLAMRLGSGTGICVLVGLPEGGVHGATNLAESSRWILFVQSPDTGDITRLREAADAKGLLGRRLFAALEPWSRIPLADNLAGMVVVSDAGTARVPRGEVLRVLRPEGMAWMGGREFLKPFPPGGDSWSHVYHGPDNNPLSTDRLARWPCLTQFLAEPLFVPMPEVSVAAGGRVFRAFGHLAHQANQNRWLNTLVCVDGYNGLILWTRPLREGFMIHRCTMVATREVLYLADDQSCKLLDARTGAQSDEIVVPPGLADGPVWKWMALDAGVLYALVGAEEVHPPTQRSGGRQMGHWPWGMWPGHDYRDPATNFGFGRTLLAIDVASRKVRWSHREEAYLDARGLCMDDDRIYCWAPGTFLLALDRASGTVAWRNASPDLLGAIGPEGRAQLWETGYATTSYLKCGHGRLFFAGPQRSRLVVVSAADGALLWQRERGNFQVVLCEDGIYAAGTQRPTDPHDHGAKLTYDGQVLAQLPKRRACSRATATPDSVFFRANGGTIRIERTTDTAHHIAPMRPPCHDGIIVSEGHLYWGPWMCGCQLSLYGHIALAPAGDLASVAASGAPRLEPGDGDPGTVRPLPVEPGDWPCSGADSARSQVVSTGLSEQLEPRWRTVLARGVLPTAPVTAGGMVFVADRSGAVTALGADGSLRWKAYTGGSVCFAPALWRGRLFAGSCDGRVYAFEAATGRLLWACRVGPAERLLFAYGELISTWPVAGGVAVEDGVVYAAAGLTHYDGTHVVALDAISGALLWHNGSSGLLSPTAASGISLQGEVRIEKGEFRFAGGGVYETARFQLSTGACLNPPYDGIESRYHTAFYAYYPEYGRHLSLDCPLPDGSALEYDITYEGSRHGRLRRLAPLPPGASRPGKPLSRWGWPPRNAASMPAVWESPTDRRYTAFVVASNVLLAAGDTSREGRTVPFLAAVRLEDGADLWVHELPGLPVRGGLAVDRSGQVYVSFEDGGMACFGPPR